MLGILEEEGALIWLPKRVLDKIYFCPMSGCWIWDSDWNSGNGYGKVKHQGKAHMAHRLVYSFLRGEIPDDHVLDHLCRVRRCVNPDHLEPVTVRENTLRGEAILFSGK